MSEEQGTVVRSKRLPLPPIEGEVAYIREEKKNGELICYCLVINIMGGEAAFTVSKSFWEGGHMHEHDGRGTLVRIEADTEFATRAETKYRKDQSTYSKLVNYLKRPSVKKITKI